MSHTLALQRGEAERAAAALGPLEQYHLAGAIIEVEDAERPRLRRVVTGWIGCCRTLPDGRRQILRLVVPGELLLTSSGVGPSLCTAVALTRARTVDYGPVADLLSPQHPQQARVEPLVAATAARNQADLLNQLVRLGRMSAYERAAHLLLDLHERLGGGFPHPRATLEVPLTQEMLADVLGLSIVHVNRTLQQMRREGLIAYRSGRVTFFDPRALAEACDYPAVREAEGAA